MVASLSHCSQSLNNNLPLAQHEKLITQLRCNEASVRIERNLKSISNSTELDNSRKMSAISKKCLSIWSNNSDQPSWVLSVTSMLIFHIISFAWIIHIKFRLYNFL